MRILWFSLAAVSVVWLAMAAGAGRNQGGNVISAEVLDGNVNAPEFPTGLDWLNTSTPLRLKDLRGKFVLLDFWTFCCINCMHILPELKKLENKYSQELVVIGVHSAKFKNEKDTGQIRDAILRYEIHHPVVNDSSFEVWNSFTVSAWPTTVLINPAGRVIGKYSGEGVYEPFDNILGQAIPYFEKKGLLKRSPLQLSLEEARRANTLLSFPGKISADEKTGRMFLTDSNHNRILVVDGAGRILDVIGSGEEGHDDGGFEAARFHHPQGTVPSGDVLYIADTENHLVREADLNTRKITTVLGTGSQARMRAGMGRGRSAELNSPWDLTILDGKLYIAMAGAHQLWVADMSGWETRPFAGSGLEDIRDGSLTQAALAQPSGITTDGHKLYFADSETSSVREADLSGSGEVKTLVGKGLFEFGDVVGNFERARLQHPLGVTVRNGLVYVADTYNSRIKVIDLARRTVSVFAGSGRKSSQDGKFAEAAFNEPGGLAWLGGKLYVADTNNHAVRVLDPATKSVSMLEFSGLEKLSRSQMDRFRGRVVDLGEREVSTVAPSLALNVVLPEGYKFNHDAPFFLRWRAANGAALKFGLEPDKVSFKDVRFPLEVPVEHLEGRADMTIDTVVYYCTTQPGTCFVDPIRLKLALRATAAAPKTTPVEIVVRKPGSGG